MLQGTCPTCHDFGPPGCLKTEPAEVGFVHTTVLFNFSGDTTLGGLFRGSDTTDRSCKVTIFFCFEQVAIHTMQCVKHDT